MLSYLYKILMVTVELFMRVFPAAISFADIRQEQCTRRQVTERALKQQQQQQQQQAASG